MASNKIVKREGSKCLSDIYQRTLFSDFTIISHGKRFEVHKNILASSIPYFEMMFNTKMVESTSNELTCDSSTEALEMIIKWSYCQPITITSDNVRQLAELADYMSIPALITECLTFISENTSNAIFNDFSNFINYNGTRKMVERYICANFCDIVCTDEFLTYDFDTIDDILSLEYLNIENEMDVFDAIIKWIAADSQHRHDHLDELLKKIYWVSMDETRFINVAKNIYVKSRKSTRKIIKAAFDLAAFNGCEDAKHLKLIDRPRSKFKRFSLRFERSSDANVYLKTLEPPFVSICINEDDDLNKHDPKFFKANLVDYNTNSSEVIRIDWKSKKFCLMSLDSELYSCLFGYLFAFETKASGKITFWKGSRSIQLGQIPNDYLSIMAIAPYKGHFYTVIKEAESISGFKFRISTFNPIKKIWIKLSQAPGIVPKSCNAVIIKISNGKVSLFFGQSQEDEEDEENDENSFKNIFMSSIDVHWIYDINGASWSQKNELVLKAKSDPDIVKKFSNQIQLLENQLEVLKSTIGSEESCCIV